MPPLVPLAFLLGMLSSVPEITVVAQPSRLACVGEAGVRDQVEARTGRRASLRLNTAASDPTQAALVRVEVRTAAGTSTRSLAVAESECPQLEQVLALVVATLLDAEAASPLAAQTDPSPTVVGASPAPQPTATHEPNTNERSDEPHGPRRAYVRGVGVGAGLTFGALPQTAWRVGASAALGLGERGALELYAFALLPEVRRVAAGSVEAYALGGELDGCFEALRRRFGSHKSWVGLCGRAQASAVHARGSGFALARSRALPQLALGAGLELGHTFASWAAVRLRAGLLAAALRPDFEVRDPSRGGRTVYEPDLLQPDGECNFLIFF